MNQPSDARAGLGQSGSGAKPRGLAPRRYIVRGWLKVPVSGEVIASNAREAAEKARNAEWEPGTDFAGMAEGGIRGIEVARD